VDEAILALVQSEGITRVMEVGASDGSSSLNLLTHGGKDIDVILTDRHPYIFSKRVLPGLKVFLNGAHRLLGVKLFMLYYHVAEGREKAMEEMTRINTLNPVVQANFGIEGIRAFDVFQDVSEEPVDIIKAANLLNLEYFSQADIELAVNNLSKSLTEGGILFISQNNDCYDEGEAYFSLRRQGGEMIMLESENAHRAALFFAKPWVINAY